ncbi:MAG: glutamate--tRNA ligase [Lentisphaeria bacterium]|nr:glutamate--tRNA ligase [Lentisphaeria bacterium]
MCCSSEKRVRTRFAPSPTGFMHVGNLRTALYAYLLAKSRHGDFVLRIEDTDQARYVEGAVQVIYDTLARAGLRHDEGPDRPGAYGPYVQSERREIYKKYAEELVRKGAAYYCFCGKHEAEPEGEESVSDAACVCPCRSMDPAAAAEMASSGRPHVIRQKIDRSGVSVFTDAVFGEITIENKVLDDQILLKSDGMPTYNFANVVDDHLMCISHVVRGSEYLSSTPKYNLLYRAFGWEIPVYVHLPLIMGRNADGEISKLSKRHGSVSFENLLAEGYLPEAVVNYIALLGWSPKSDQELFRLEELAEKFDVSGLNKSPAVFDYGKLRWMNSEYIKMLSPEAFAEVARPFAALPEKLSSAWPKIAAILHQRTELLSEIPGKIAFLAEVPAFENDLFFNKKSKCSPETAREILTELIPRFEALEALTPEAVGGIISAYAESHGVKLGQPMWAVRIALSGLPVTPGGPGEIMDIIGKDESLKRLKAALERL